MRKSRRAVLTMFAVIALIGATTVTASAGPTTGPESPAVTHAEWTAAVLGIMERSRLRNAQSLVAIDARPTAADTISGCPTDGPVFQLLADELAQWTSEQRSDVFYLSNLATAYALSPLNTSTDYGPDGEYTSLNTRGMQTLVGFWAIPGWKIRNVPWHGDPVFDLAKMTALFRQAGYEDTVAAQLAEQTVATATTVPDLAPDSLVLTFNSYAIPEDPRTPPTILTGDGVPNAYTRAGYDASVVVPLVLAHEFGHHVQFNTWDIAPHNGMSLEMEADAFSGYYLAHARGGQLTGWDRKEAVRAYGEIGDCYGSHGTPEQRSASGKWGEGQALFTGNKTAVLAPATFHKRWALEFNRLTSRTSALPAA